MQRTPQQQLWIALSSLYLDADVTAFYADINRVIEEHGFSDLEVERTLIEEVELVLHHNLTSTAGEWAAFDEGWLLEQITTAIQNPNTQSSRPWSLRGYAHQHLKALRKQRTDGA